MEFAFRCDTRLRIGPSHYARGGPDDTQCDPCCLFHISVHWVDSYCGKAIDENSGREDMEGRITRDQSATRHNSEAEGLLQRSMSEDVFAKQDAEDQKHRQEVHRATRRSRFTQ